MGAAASEVETHSGFAMVKLSHTLQPQGGTCVTTTTAAKNRTSQSVWTRRQHSDRRVHSGAFHAQSNMFDSQASPFS